MQLSILMPTHRDDLVAHARLAQACSWAGPDVEVIIRDNSGSASKRELLKIFERAHCKIAFAENRGPLENYSETLKLAGGEFVYFVADDDSGFDRAMAALPGVIADVAGDPGIIGLTGAYVVEGAQSSAVVGYQDIDSNDPVARITGFLKFQGPNVLIYSPVRRALVQRVFEFMNAMPFSLSFHDQMICLLYLLEGKFSSIKRMLYLYEYGEWEFRDLAQKRDLSFYTAANLDPAVNLFHWFLCGFEGAVLIRNAAVVSLPAAQRQAAADLWFSAMFMRFKNFARGTFDSRFDSAANALSDKLKISAGQLLFQDMLIELCAFMALSSQANAQKYHDFWSAIIGKTAAPVG